MDQHLKKLEQEAIELIREVITTYDLRQVWSLYAAGKESCVMLRLLVKAFYPRPINIKFLNFDTGFESAEMRRFIGRSAKENQLMLHVVRATCDPRTAGYVDLMDTSLFSHAMQRLDIKVVFCGGHRYERMTRTKKNMVSIRGIDSELKHDVHNSVISKLWNTASSKDSTLRVFPLSNWTELDVWEYVRAEKIDVVPMYFSHPRNVVEMGGLLLPSRSEEGEPRRVRFHTLRGYPLTAAIESEASSVDDIIDWLRLDCTV